MGNMANLYAIVIVLIIVGQDQSTTSLYTAFSPSTLDLSTSYGSTVIDAMTADEYMFVILSY